MNLRRKRRLLTILFLIFGVSVAVALVLYALKQNINLYYTPTQLAELTYSVDNNIRIGGVVETGSVRYKQGLQMDFVITDFTHAIAVQYAGILPTLFREGQGVVVEGKLNNQGIFVANQVLAKHDANYRPPGIGKK